MAKRLEAKTKAEEGTSSPSSSWLLFTVVITVARSSFRVDSCGQNSSSGVENINTSSDAQDVSSGTDECAASSASAFGVGASDGDIE